jgi:hypothetical protein
MDQHERGVVQDGPDGERKQKQDRKGAPGGPERKERLDFHYGHDRERRIRIVPKKLAHVRMVAQNAGAAIHVSLTLSLASEIHAISLLLSY